MTSPPPSDALDVLELMRAAAIARSAGDMSSVYALERGPRVPLHPAGRPGPSRGPGRDHELHYRVLEHQPAEV